MTDSQLAAFRALLEDMDNYGTASLQGHVRCREIALLAAYALIEIDRLRAEVQEWKDCLP